MEQDNHISNYLQTALNLGQVQPELQPSKTGELVKVLKEKRICELSNIGDLEAGLRYCMALVGIRAANLPTVEEKAILIRHISTYYSGHTVAEIRLAFEKAIAGELDIEPGDVKAFENFTAIYFSQIMNSYRRWAVQEFRQNVKTIDPPPPQRIFTQEELDDGAREDVERQYQAFLRKMELKATEFNRSILAKDGLLREGETTVEFFTRRAAAGSANIYEKK